MSDATKRPQHWTELRPRLGCTRSGDGTGEQSASIKSVPNSRMFVKSPSIQASYLSDYAVCASSFPKENQYRIVAAEKNNEFSP
jgi:hypothetical protein